MKRSFDFTREINLGKLGTRTCEICYSEEDGHIEIMSVWIVNGDGSLGVDLTDWITDSTNDELVALAQSDLPAQLAEEAEYMAELARDAA